MPLDITPTLWPFSVVGFSADGPRIGARRIAGDPDPRGSEILQLPAKLSGADCDAVVDLANTFPMFDAVLRNGSLDERKCMSASIPPGSASQWLYRRVEGFFAEANSIYSFDLTGMDEPLQFLQYESGGHVTWHMDLARIGARVRKVALSIQLSHATEYDGGRLEFLGAGGEVPGSRTRGTVIAFPSFAAHRVTPVTRGRRLALIALATGPRFR